MICHIINKRAATLFILFCASFFAVHAQQSQKLFTSLPSSQTGVTFRNDVIETADIYYFKYQHIYNGSGVAVGDINNDGLPDIYFSSTLGQNKLYLNLGNMKFRDITETARVAGTNLEMVTGVNMFDINNDGFLDILVCKSNSVDAAKGKKYLYINNGNNTFTEKAKEYGLNDDSYSLQSYFVDYDNDGDMDVFFVNHPRDFETITRLTAKMENGVLVRAEDTAAYKISNRLFENRNGHFFDVTKKAGLLTHNAYGLSGAIYDFNHDGWPDIYVTNDFNKPDYLYINNKNGTFREDYSGYFEHACFFSMGMDINDLNNDGLEDVFNLDMASEDPVRQKQLFVLNMNYDKIQIMKKLGLNYQYPKNSVSINNGNGHYSDIAWYSGMAQTDWSWSPLIADYNNDGWKDVFITNGYKRDVTDWDYKEFVLDSIKNLMARGQSVNLEEWFKLIPQTRVNNYFFHNNGTLHFDDATSTWSDAAASFSHGAAYADLDNDGDLDLVVNNMDDEASIMQNNSNVLNPSHYLRFRFFNNKEQKREVYGAMVKLVDDAGSQQVQHYDPQRGYLSTMEHVLHFGCGKMTVIPKVEVRFLSGKKILMNNVPTDRIIDIFESDGVRSADEAKPAPIFKEVVQPNKFKYTQVENDYIDFKREPLLPYKCSRKGPYYAKADVNGDKLDDIFIGGSTGNEKKLMLQNADGSFTEKKQAFFGTDKKYEDCGAAFFDADGDGDADLYVVSGGAEFDAGSPLYQDRLYINDGKGNFNRSLSALPAETNNGSCVIPLDFNGDGQMDLFVGGGVTPGRFPKHDNCMLLQNNHGVFKDVTAEYMPSLTALTGIVNTAVWKDIDADNKPELLIAGEWMPVIIFKWKDGKFSPTDAQVTMTVANKERRLGMNELTGWWNCMKLEDVDNDGDMDIIVGNRGMNSRIFAGIDEPCTIYAKDFDNNGSYDAVLGYYIQGKCYPMYHRDQLIDQMPMFRKKYYRYRMYSGRTLDELFTADQKKGMDIYKTSCFTSGILINDGNNNFHFNPLPEMAQLSTINDVLFEDLDHDGKKDLLVCGNNNDADVGTGNYDAMAALFLKGDGKGGFTAVMAGASGLSIRGEVRRMVYLENSGRVIFLKNNAAAQEYNR